MSDESMNNFTPRAQQVLALARKEADRFNHNFVTVNRVRETQPASMQCLSGESNRSQF